MTHDIKIQVSQTCQSDLNPNPLQTSGKIKLIQWPFTVILYYVKFWP